MLQSGPDVFQDGFGGATKHENIAVRRFRINALPIFAPRMRHGCGETLKGCGSLTKPAPTPVVTHYDIARDIGVSQTTVSRALSGDPRVSDETRRTVMQTAAALGYRSEAERKLHKRERSGARLTSFDIAERARVSQSTVSRALRGDSTISEDTRQRVQAVAQELGYIVDKNASNLRLMRSNTIAVLLFEDPSPDGSSINPFFQAMLGSITRAAALHGYDLLISFQKKDQEWNEEYENGRKADGLILLGYGDYVQYQHHLANLISHNKTFICWGVVREAQAGLSVGSDNFAGGRLAAEHLISIGRRHIAFLGDISPHQPEFMARYEGYRAALQAAGLKPGPQANAFSSQGDGERAISQLLAKRRKFDAVFAASDMLAAGALRALRRKGLRVPDDVSVVGYDDIAIASLIDPPLTTVAQDTESAGTTLVDALIAQIRDGGAKSTIITPKLIVRASSCHTTH